MSPHAQGVGEFVGEAEALGDGPHLLVGVELLVLADHHELGRRQPEVSTQGDVARGLEVLEVVFVPFQASELGGLLGQGPVEQRDRVGDHQAHAVADRVDQDEELVCNADDAEDATIVNSVLTLANNFDRRALAEGIETEAQRERLAAAGCNYGQGFLFSRPIPEHDFFDFLAGQGAHASP